MKPDAPNSMQRRMTPPVLVAGYHDHGRARMLRAQETSGPEKPCTPGMLRSSRIRSTSEPLPSSSVTSSKVPASTTEMPFDQAEDGLAQGAANERMIVGYHDGV